VAGLRTMVDKFIYMVNTILEIMLSIYMAVIYMCWWYLFSFFAILIFADFLDALHESL
jgi:hypothetical protein